MFEDISAGFFRVVSWVIWEFFFCTFCYYLGWPVCKLLTLGRYPRPRATFYSEYDDTVGGWPCALVGFVLWILLSAWGIELFY